MKLIVIIAITTLIFTVNCGTEWNQAADGPYKNADGSKLSEGDIAKKFWIYSNSAYCAEKAVDL
jgi:hypothetical protein